MAPWSRSRLKKKQEPEPEALKYFFFIFCSQYQSKETLDFNQAKYLIITALCLYIMHSALVQMKVLPVPIIVSSPYSSL